MTETASLLAAIDSASIIDKVTGFNISKWAAEGEVTIQLIHDEYKKAKENALIILR